MKESHRVLCWPGILKWQNPQDNGRAQDGTLISAGAVVPTRCAVCACHRDGWTVLLASKGDGGTVRDTAVISRPGTGSRPAVLGPLSYCAMTLVVRARVALILQNIGIGCPWLFLLVRGSKAIKTVGQHSI